MTTKTGSYEVYIDVRHHPKHAEDEERESTCFKFVDTGDPKQMVANGLRAFAGDIKPEEDEPYSLDSIYGALDRCRARILEEWAGSPNTRSALLQELDGLCAELGIEWYGVRS